ncbi:hypothetical protein GCM10028832_29040 [Streptomyces sparsus]
MPGCGGGSEVVRGFLIQEAGQVCRAACRPFAPASIGVVSGLLAQRVSEVQFGRLALRLRRRTLPSRGRGLLVRAVGSG